MSSRTDFERDRARILHSAAFRRLGAKTQVIGPSSDDFVRTRLTHSMEVAQVGRGVGQELGCDPDIVDAACLAHDMGHPPFGHNGERALNEAAADIGGFEGNAQTFRIVSRLETKVWEQGSSFGLNLTRATLDATCKYPWSRGRGADPELSQTKYGVYEDDWNVFSWMRSEAPPFRRCLEAQIMDFSDDIAYSAHDIEDAVVTGHLQLGDLAETSTLDRVFALTQEWYGTDVDLDQLSAAANRLMKLPYWPETYVDSYRGRSQMKDLTSQLIGRFCAEAVQATRERYGTEPLGRYRADLVIPHAMLAEVQFLKGVAAYFVMSPREVEPVYYQQRTVVLDLVDALMEAGPDQLEGPLAEEWRNAENEAGQLRAVIDQVASLTDVSATQWHARLCGMFSTLL